MFQWFSGFFVSIFKMLRCFVYLIYMGIKLLILAIIAGSGLCYSLYGIYCLWTHSSMSIASHSLIAFLFIDIVLCAQWGSLVYGLYDHMLYALSFINELFVYLYELIIFKYRFLRYCVISILISMNLMILANIYYMNIYYFDIIGADYIFSKLLLFSVILALILYLSFFCKPLDHLMLVPKAQMPINNFLDFLRYTGWLMFIWFYIFLFNYISSQLIGWTWGYVCGECLALIIPSSDYFDLLLISLAIVGVFVVILILILSYCLQFIAIGYYDLEVRKRWGNFLKDRLIYRTFVKNCLLIYSFLMCFVAGFLICVIFPTIDMVYQIGGFSFFVLKLILLYRVYVHKKEAIQA